MRTCRRTHSHSSSCWDNRFVFPPAAPQLASNSPRALQWPVFQLPMRLDYCSHSIVLASWAGTRCHVDGRIRFGIAASEMGGSFAEWTLRRGRIRFDALFSADAGFPRVFRDHECRFEHEGPPPTGMAMKTSGRGVADRIEEQIELASRRCSLHRTTQLNENFA